MGTTVEWTRLTRPPVEVFAATDWARSEIESLRKENRRIRRENTKLRAQLHEASEKQQLGEAVESFVRNLFDRLRAIQETVAEFAFQRQEKLERVLLTLASGRFYFLFMLRKGDYDWNLSDELGDLHAAMLEQENNVPLSCAVVPGGFGNEEYLSEYTLSILQLGPQEAPEEG